MSVWKARELWEPSRVSTKSSAEGPSVYPLNCSRGSLCVHSVGQAESSYIFVGSWDGSFRGFLPDRLPFAEEHLLFDEQLRSPVLQILSGNFISSSTKSEKSFQVALLHPAAVSVYYCNVDDQSSPASFLKHVRTYSFKSSTFAMVGGSFGGLRGREMMCISTLSGNLILIDNETITESPVLENSLMPGPICYLPARDAIVIGSSAWTVDCYLYSELAASAGLAASKTPQSSAPLVRKLWSYNCGEPLLDIAHNSTSVKSPILILGERHIFLLETNGVMRSIRRTEMPMSSLSLYSSGTDASINMITTSATQSLFVFRDMVPVWTAQFPYNIVCAKVARVGNMDGVVVTLSDDGSVTGWYLGTNPEIYESRQSAGTRSLTTEEVKTESNNLNNMIKAHEEGGSAETNSKSATLVRVLVEDFREIGFTVDVSSGSAKNVPVSKSTAIVEFLDTVSEFVIDFHMEEPFAVKPSQASALLNGNTAKVEFSVVNTLRSTVGRLTGHVIVRFKDARGSQLAHRELFMVPLSLVAHGAPLMKRGALKFDFETSPKALRFNEVLPDMVSGDQNDGGITLDFYGTGHVTLLISKKHEMKVRVQSDDPGLINLVTKELQRRAEILYPGNTLTCYSNLPSDELRSVISHINENAALYKNAVADLDLWSQQLFIVEKRFLNRLKDRDAKIVGDLELLLEVTQDKIFEGLEKCAALHAQSSVLRRDLVNLLSFALFLVSLNNRTLPETMMKELHGIIVTAIQEDANATWEEHSAEAAAYVVQQFRKNNPAIEIDRQDSSDVIILLERAYMNQIQFQQAMTKKLSAP